MDAVQPLRSTQREWLRWHDWRSCTERFLVARRYSPVSVLPLIPAGSTESPQADLTSGESPACGEREDTALNYRRWRHDRTKTISSHAYAAVAQGVRMGQESPWLPPRNPPESVERETASARLQHRLIELSLGNADDADERHRHRPGRVPHQTFSVRLWRH